jgi:hypothetical protein
MVTQVELFESPDLTALEFCLWGIDKEQNLQNKI